MSPLALHELKEKLQRLDVDCLLELLKVTPEELVEAMSWKIEDNLELLEKEIDNYE